MSIRYAATTAAAATCTIFTNTCAQTKKTTTHNYIYAYILLDLSQASKILVDGFYRDNNTVSKWWEKLQTQMSLESNLPHPYSHPQHEMWVACHPTTGQVLAFCEVDNRPPKQQVVQQQQQRTTTTSNEMSVVRPYMCNLAVHLEWRRQGLARDLIRQCESSVECWQEDNTDNDNDNDNDACYRLFLKVKKQNDSAVRLYTEMGYQVTATEFDETTQDTLLVMRREWTTNDDNDTAPGELVEEVNCSMDKRNEMPMSTGSSSYEI